MRLKQNIGIHCLDTLDICLSPYKEIVVVRYVTQYLD